MMRSCWILRRLAGLAIGAGLASGVAWAQSPAAAKPEFEVASVRPSADLDPQKMMAAMQSGQMPRMGAHVDGLRAEYLQMPLLQLVANAYDVKPYQVTGPDTLKGQRFDIVARMPEGSTKDDAPKMLRTLLEQRFKLEATKGTTEKPVYALVVGKGGPKLKESTEKPTPVDPEAPLNKGEMKMDGPNGVMIIKINPDGSSSVNMGEKGKYVQRVDMAAKVVHLEGSPVTMEGLAEMLSQLATAGPAARNGRQVVDATELKGYYEIVLDLSLAELMRSAGQGAGGTAGTEASDPTGGMGIEDSVQKMGLKLEPRKAPVEQVVVTHVEKAPTEN